MREEDKHVNTVLRALEILECFKSEQVELSLTEISNITGLQKSRLIRLCGTLIFKGYLNRDKNSLKYSLGPQLMVLGRIYESVNTLANVSKPILKKLAKLTNETVSLFTVYKPKQKRLCLARVDGSHPIRYVNEEGDILDLHRGVGGKILLSHMEDVDQEKILAGVSSGSKSGLDASGIKALLAELKKIKRRGYAKGISDVIEGAASIGVPVFDHAGICCASMVIVGPIQRFTEERFSALTKNLLESAAQLSFRLGYDSYIQVYPLIA